MNMILVVGAGAFIIAFAFYLRVKTRIILRYYGVDAWYFLLYAEELRRTKKLPVSLPYYLLDNEEQWYPPGLPLLLSLFSKDSLLKLQWLISPVIDCIQLLFLYTVTFYLTHNIIVSVLAGIMYAMTRTLISENSNLNSRSLGSLLFVLLMHTIAGFIITKDPIWIIPMGIIGVLVLITHKLSTQLFVFIMIGMSVLYKNLVFLIIPAGVIILAIVLTGGFYVKIIKGHIEILRFWKRNINNLLAHQVYASSIYAGNGEYRDCRFYMKGAKELAKHILRMAGNNTYVVFLFPAFYLYGSFSEIQRFYFLWAVITYCFIFITTFIPWMRFLGEGYKYIKLAVFPVCILAAMLFNTNPLAATLIFAFVSVVNLFLISHFYGIIQMNPAQDAQNDLMNITEYIKNSSEDGIMVIPNMATDALAYFTRKKVCWGSHSSGWDKLQEQFPVLNKPIEYFFRKYSLHYLLLDTGYVNPETFKLDDFSVIMREGKYNLYEWCPRDKINVT